MMKWLIFASLALVLIIVGCTNKIPETTPSIGEAACIYCQSKCSGAGGTSCIDGKCECYYEEKDNNSESYQGNNSKNNLENNQSNLNKEPMSVFEIMPSCGERMDYLSISPLKYGDFTGITPLGNLNPSGHTFPTDHIYLWLKRVDEKNWGAGTANVPLYMPGEAWINEITAVEHLSDNPPFTDYDFSFSPCKELSFRLGHITSLSEELIAKSKEGSNCDKEYTTGGKRFRVCKARNINIKVNAGQIVGTAGGNPDQNALDIWATDMRAERVEFANSKRWQSNSAISFTTCPLDYFISTEKTKLYSLLKGWDNNKRTIEPLCGTIEQDIKGTAQGVWFLEGTENTYPEDPHLALVLDNGNPIINVFSVGTSIPNLGTNKYLFSPESTGEVNIAFSKVKPGTVYCYEQADWNFVIVLELLDEETLKIEKQTNSKCREPFRFTSGVLFER
ncbi:MAG: hypothetical protein AABW92_04310 [Nanoarchaeota archaeon]